MRKRLKKKRDAPISGNEKSFQFNENMTRGGPALVPTIPASLHLCIRSHSSSFLLLALSLTIFGFTNFYFSTVELDQLSLSYQSETFQRQISSGKTAEAVDPAAFFAGNAEAAGGAEEQMTPAEQRYQQGVRRVMWGMILYVLCGVTGLLLATMCTVLPKTSHRPMPQDQPLGL